MNPYLIENTEQSLIVWRQIRGAVARCLADAIDAGSDSRKGYSLAGCLTGACERLATHPAQSPGIRRRISCLALGSLSSALATSLWQNEELRTIALRAARHLDDAFALALSGPWGVEDDSAVCE